MASITEPFNLGDLLKFEESHLFSRDRVTVAAGEHLPLGTVVGVITATNKVAQLDPTSSDGRQVAAGVMLPSVVAKLTC